MKQRMAYFISVVMISVFTLYLIPHEFVHVFYDHEDTEHSDFAHHSGTSISHIHVHCDFLCTEIADFVPAKEHRAPETFVSLQHNYADVEVQSIRVLTSLRESRGPPFQS